MAKLVTCNGNEAVAYAFMHVDPDVAGVFPITPSTSVAEKLAAMSASGDINTEVIHVEGENSALTVCIAASAAGARAVTATNSQGWLYMAQQVWQASGMRRPLVVPIATRQIGGPLNIWGSHSDVMALRDGGWIMRFAKDVQEVYDFTVQAFPNAEDPGVRLPHIVAYDGFTISHTSTQIQIADRDQVSKFVGPYIEPYSLLDPEVHCLHGAPVTPQNFMEVERAKNIAMQNALSVIQSNASKFSEEFWPTSVHLEEYELYDAEYVVVVMGGSSGVVKAAVKEARAEGLPVGMLRVITYRPFPTQEVHALLSGLRGVVVLDRATSIGAPQSPLATDVAVSVGKDVDRFIGCVFGLGGRDLQVSDVQAALTAIQNEEHDTRLPMYLNTRM